MISQHFSMPNNVQTPGTLPAIGRRLEKGRIRRRYSLIAAVLGWTFLCVGYCGGGNFGSLTGTVSYFSYFSTLSNGMAAVILTLAASQYAERESASKAWPVMATGVLVYIFVTAIPFLGQPVWLSNGWHGAANLGFHHVMPILYALFWILFVPKGSLARRHALL